MKNGYLKFCKNYKEKLELDKDIKENKLSFFEDFRDRITFKLNMAKSCPHTITFGDTSLSLFTLDQEDLEYLHNKYSAKLEEEMKKNIEEIKNKYER